MARLKYTKTETQIVTGVQINLETDGVRYVKWGSNQYCKAGDWLVNNDGECYTIEKDSFAKSYKEISPGRYVKSGTVWAEQASEDGSVMTKEGISKFQAGDYIISNNEDGTDSYTIQKGKFELTYRLESE